MHAVVAILNFTHPRAINKKFSYISDKISSGWKFMCPVFCLFVRFFLRMCINGNGIFSSLCAGKNNLGPGVSKYFEQIEVQFSHTQCFVYCYFCCFKHFEHRTFLCTLFADKIHNFLVLILTNFHSNSVISSSFLCVQCKLDIHSLFNTF